MTWLNHRILVLLEEVIHASQDCAAVRAGERCDAATPSQPIALLQVNRSRENHEPVGTDVNVLTSRIVFSPRRGMASKSMQRTTPRDACGRMTASDQLQPLQTRMPVLADDMWSCTEMPSGVAIWTIALVIWISACDGVGSPEGWLCTRSFNHKAHEFPFFDFPMHV